MEVTNEVTKRREFFKDFAFIMGLLALLFAVLVSAQPASAQVMRQAGVYNSTLPTYTTGSIGEVQLSSKGVLYATIMDTNGSAAVSVITPSDANAATGGLVSASRGQLWNGTTWDRQYTILGAVGQATGLGVTAVEENGRLFNHQNTNTTVTIKSGAGFLHNAFVGTPGTGETITCYDSLTATGTVIFVLTPTNAGSNILDVRFGTGLTCVTAGTTAGDYTFAYR